MRSVIVNNVIADGTTIVGSIEIEGALRIEGLVNGVIYSKSRVYIARTGQVTSDIHCSEAVIGGKIVIGLGIAS